MKATIEIDDNLIPEGYEVVAFRRPAMADSFIQDSGRFATNNHMANISGPRLILRRKWQWPAWLTCRAIAKDGGGSWICCGRTIPKLYGNGTWTAIGDHFTLIDGNIFDLSQFPDCKPEDSLRINPNWKE